MTTWQYSIDVHEEFALVKRGMMGADVLGVVMAKKLKALPDTVRDNALDNIILSLETINDNKEELDFYLDLLWDWADEDHRLWIWSLSAPPVKKPCLN